MLPDTAVETRPNRPPIASSTNSSTQPIIAASATRHGRPSSLLNTIPAPSATIATLHQPAMNVNPAAATAMTRRAITGGAG